MADHCLCGVLAPVDELSDFHVANGAGVPLNDETRQGQVQMEHSVHHHHHGVPRRRFHC